MSWKYIFNTNGCKLWGTIHKAQEACRNAGYEFYNWNGFVYSSIGHKTIIETKDCF